MLTKQFSFWFICNCKQEWPFCLVLGFFKWIVLSYIYCPYNYTFLLSCKCLHLFWKKTKPNQKNLRLWPVLKFCCAFWFICLCLLLANSFVWKPIFRSFACRNCFSLSVCVVLASRLSHNHSTIIRTPDKCSDSSASPFLTSLEVNGLIQFLAYRI